MKERSSNGAGCSLINSITNTIIHVSKAIRSLGQPIAEWRITRSYISYIWRIVNRAAEEERRYSTYRSRLYIGPSCRQVCHRLCHRKSHDLELAPLQLGVGVPGEAEAAIYATRRYVSNMPDDHVIITLDFKNAFNSLRRDAMLEAVERDVPELYRFAQSAYTPSNQYGNDTVKSRKGPQQGDPLGPLMFCITIKPLLSLFQSELPIGFLDYLTIGGQLDIITRDVELI